MVLLVIVISFFGFGVRSNGRQIMWFRVIVLLYTTSLFLYLLYLCKDPYYLGLFLEYIPLPRAVILQLYTLQLSRTLIAGLMNLNSLLFLYCNVTFAMGFLLPQPTRLKHVVYFAVGIYCLLSFLLFEPNLYSKTYSLLYPSLMEPGEVEHLYGVLSGITSAVNIILLAGCAGVIALRIIRSPKIQLLRLTLGSVGISYSILLISYLFFFNRLPAVLVRYSKAADIITYLPLITNRTMMYYPLFPYVVCIFLSLFAFSFFRLSVLRRRINENELQVAQRIKAANLSSRLFCHYMKNEILAISAEIEQLPMTAENSEVISNIQERCGQVYKRLDGIHHVMRDKVLDMQVMAVSVIIKEALNNMREAFASEEITVELDIFPQNTSVIADASILEQALNNLFRNACEAMEGVKNKRLTVTVRQDTRWVSIDVEDNGCGIGEKDLENIFTPLFSSKPMTKNWGIGLTLAHKSVTSHGGSIHVRSTPGRGTVFQLLLPVAAI